MGKKCDIVSADVYHSASRYLLGTETLTSIVLPQTIDWLFKENRLAIGLEHLRFQGLCYEASEVADFKEGTLKSLAGNAFPGLFYVSKPEGLQGLPGPSGSFQGSLAALEKIRAPMSFAP